MPDEERMSIEERYKYLRGQRRRYEVADREGKGELLSEMEAVTGLGRKRLIRLMGSEPRRKERIGQRGATYPDAVRRAVLVVAESLDFVCAERLAPSLEWTARHLCEWGELELSEAAFGQLGQISTSTVRRILASVPRERWRLPRSSPRPNPIAREIAVERIAWDIAEPGHVEIDLVHHSGRSGEGQYLHTLQAIDVATGWSERVVVVGRSYLAMAEALAQITEQLPFPLLEVHSDNGAEFLNYHLLRFWKQEQPQATLLRSRPYHKNDNPFVEQKNFTLVRAYVGYSRLDSPRQALLLAQIYELMRSYYNYFQPVMHLVEKRHCRDENDRLHTKRRYDRAATPLDRLLALCGEENDSLKREVEARLALNPRHLRERIYQLLGELRATPGASALGDVRQIIEAMHQHSAFSITLPKEAALSR